MINCFKCEKVVNFRYRLEKLRIRLTVNTVEAMSFEHIGHTMGEPHPGMCLGCESPKPLAAEPSSDRQQYLEVRAALPQLHHGCDAAFYPVNGGDEVRPLVSPLEEMQPGQLWHILLRDAHFTCHVLGYSQ